MLADAEKTANSIKRLRTQRLLQGAQPNKAWICVIILIIAARVHIPSDA